MNRSEIYSFHIRGPTRLKAVDWNNVNHRRSIIASLVQGVYVQEYDRQQRLKEPRAPLLAPPWWEFFDFQLYCVLSDQVDTSIFGAVYEKCNSYDSASKAPKYVIAFRGNFISEGTIVRDLKLDVECCFNKLNSDDNMARLNYRIETYLYNPPFPSLTDILMKWTKSTEKTQDKIRIAKSFVKATLVAAAQASNKAQHDPFRALYDWHPKLFVNRGDLICSGYIAYFEHISSGTTLPRGAEGLHLLPSANLYINTKNTPLLQAHAHEQWWNPDTDCELKVYHYN
ncbi:GDSL esterase/lipase At4g10955-like [Quercus lobata]|uniref:Uncharacterized protein n=1 Tax=Quercus lobata TaxID=97700 RepID=A0A7N2L7Q6_QUELO|nr:GDSL esterase/lipase At4g10955-like [Quercus lobata]